MTLRKRLPGKTASRRKFGTVLDPEIVARAKRMAAAEGKSLADFIEEALTAHVVRKETGVSPIDTMRGMFKLTPEAWREVLEADLYDT